MANRDADSWIEGGIGVAFEDGDSLPSPIAKVASTLTGFDREGMDTGEKQNGILQYCHSAVAGEVYQIGSDDAGAYALLTGQTEFADGTVLADRTLMQYHDSGETQFSYWRHGVLVEVTGAKFIQLASDYKGYIGYDENGDFISSLTDVRELIVRTPLVAYLYLNSTKGTVEWFADERHGIVMSGQTHLEQHMSIGFFVSGGLDIIGVANNGTTLTSVDSGACGDEDVKMTFAEATTAPKIYLEGAASEWTITDDDSNLGIFVTGDCSYNDISGTPQLSTIGTDRVVMTLVATNNKIHPVVWLVGQELFTTRAIAHVKAASSYWRTRLNGLPSNEFHPIGSVILNSEANGTAEVGADGEIWYDHRFTDSTMRFEGE